MNNRLSSIWRWSLPAVVLPFAVGCFSHSSTKLEEPLMAESQPAQDPESESLADESQPGSEEAASMAAFQPVSAEIAVPASVKLSPSAIEIVKLASAGLDEKVMLAYL